MTRPAMFVVLAEMRTGSNFLEANLNAMAGVRCHGEAFNPHFVGRPGRAEHLGVTQEAREADPARLLRAIRAEPGLNGFRLFGDHDARVHDLVLPDPSVAKVVLTRNPLESYVSREIAARTGQWKLTDAAHARAARARFDAGRFADYLGRLEAAQGRILRALQSSGQAAFWLGYEDLQEMEVMAGLARFLGVEPPASLDRTLKKQNPEPLSEKVENLAEMEAALQRIDRWDLGRAPSFEPRRAAAIPQAVACPRAPLLFLPVPSGPTDAMRDWMARLDAPGAEEPRPLVEGFSHKSLRQWKAARPGHLSVSVLRHPLARAHAAFCARILQPDGLSEVRRTLRRTYALPVPEEGVAQEEAMEEGGWGDAEHRAAFLRFLRFLRANLGGQTGMRVDPAWASQLAIVQGFAGFVPPDLLLREADLGRDLPALAARLGRAAVAWAPRPDPWEARLARVADAEVRAAGRDACGRDHVAFGFGDWRPGA